MTLEEALRQHTGCDHADLHGAMDFERFSVFTPDGLEPAAAGSNVFHECARRILRDWPHSREPMRISDDEYASFITEPQVIAVVSEYDEVTNA